MQNYHDISKERTRKWKIVYFASAEKNWKCEKMTFLNVTRFPPFCTFATSLLPQKWIFFPKINQKVKEYVFPYRNYLVPSPHIHYFCSYNSICHHNCSCGMRKNPYFFISNSVDDKQSYMSRNSECAWTGLSSYDKGIHILLLSGWFLGKNPFLKQKTGRKVTKWVKFSNI